MQILAVVVLYKQAPEQSQTIQSLIQVFGVHPELNDSVACCCGTTVRFQRAGSLFLFLSTSVTPGET